MNWTVYLSGEIHTDWREQIQAQSAVLNLPLAFTSPVTDHQASDAAGDHQMANDNPFWRDNQSSKVNAIRTKNMIRSCDIAIVRFGDKYKQWNAAFEAGMLAALGKSYITLHDETIVHPLKEVDAGAMAWAKTPQQVVEVLRYITSQ